MQSNLRDLARAVLASRQLALRASSGRLARFDPRLDLARRRARLENAHRTAVEAMRALLAQQRSRLEKLEAKLEPLSPLLVLDRGYAIVTSPSGEVIRDAAEAPPDSEIRVRLSRGRLRARVTDGS
jgi:exodeoxyribonuclease VII large subunit